MRARAGLVAIARRALMMPFALAVLAVLGGGQARAAAPAGDRASPGPPGALAPPEGRGAATSTAGHPPGAAGWAEPVVSLGLLAGEPIGVSAALVLGERWALHADAGASTAERLRFIAAADLVYALPDALGPIPGTGLLVPWFGLGARFVTLRQAPHSPVPLSDVRDHAGLRWPFGISWVVAGAPLAFFAEIAPGLALVPSVMASLDGGIGARVGF